MKVNITPFELFHSVPPECNPDLPIPVEQKLLSREELEESDREPCEVCFPDWE